MSKSTTYSPFLKPRFTSWSRSPGRSGMGTRSSRTSKRAPKASCVSARARCTVPSRACWSRDSRRSGRRPRRRSTTASPLLPDHPLGMATARAEMRRLTQLRTPRTRARPRPGARVSRFYCALLLLDPAGFRARVRRRAAPCSMIAAPRAGRLRRADADRCGHRRRGTERVAVHLDIAPPGPTCYVVALLRRAPGFTAHGG